MRLVVEATLVDHPSARDTNGDPVKTSPFLQDGILVQRAVNVSAQYDPPAGNAVYEINCSRSVAAEIRGNSAYKVVSA